MSTAKAASRVIRAAHEVAVNGVTTPILLGHTEEVRRQIKELGLEWEPEIIDPIDAPKQAEYAERFYAQRQRKGVTLSRARELMRQKMYYGPMMVECGDADAFIAGVAYNYPEVLRPEGARAALHAISVCRLQRVPTITPSSSSACASSSSAVW